jgi:hypothetical protein
MSQSKKPSLKSVKEKDLAGFENLPGLTVTYDSCYRGKIEICTNKNGKVVSQKIIR